MAWFSRRTTAFLVLMLGMTALLAALSVVRITPSCAASEPIVYFSASDASIVVEIAATPEQRQRGLMQRDSLADGRGMLFLFEQTTSSPFWMKDTLIPLSIAFIDEHGRIVDIQDMKPLDETLHYPAASYRYAIETPQGWFARHGVLVGHEARLPATLARTGCAG